MFFGSGVFNPSELANSVILNATRSTTRTSHADDDDENNTHTNNNGSGGGAGPRRVRFSVRIRESSSSNNNNNSDPHHHHQNNNNNNFRTLHEDRNDDDSEDDEETNRSQQQQHSFTLLFPNTSYQRTVQTKREFRNKVIFCFAGMIFFASIGIPMLVLCGLYFGYIRDGPTSIVDENAITVLIPGGCVIEAIWQNCFVIKYTRVCYFRVGFNQTHSGSSGIKSINPWMMNDQVSHEIQQPVNDQLISDKFIINNKRVPTLEMNRDDKNEATSIIFADEKSTNHAMTDTTGKYKSLMTTPAYDITIEPFRSLRVNDTVLCYSNKNETKVGQVQALNSF